MNKKFFRSTENYEISMILLLGEENILSFSCISPYTQSCIMFIVKIFNAKIFISKYFSMNFPFNHG